MARHPGFPFEPKSTTFVRPGDFWAIPTRRGGWYCCGQILAISDLTTSRSLVVGLLNWCEPHPPTEAAINGVRVLDYGIAHVKTVRETGGVLLGHCPLAPEELARLVGDSNWRDRGVWGYRHIAALAHKYFGRHFPDNPPVAIERPPPLQSPGDTDQESGL